MHFPWGLWQSNQRLVQSFCIRVSNIPKYCQPFQLPFEIMESPFHESGSVVSYSQDASQFLVGVGGVLAVVLSVWFGRLPVLFWFMVVALATAAEAAGATNLGGYVTSRILNGLTASAAQGVNSKNYQLQI